MFMKFQQNKMYITDVVAVNDVRIFTNMFLLYNIHISFYYMSSLNIRKYTLCADKYKTNYILNYFNFKFNMSLCLGTKTYISVILLILYNVNVTNILRNMLRGP